MGEGGVLWGPMFLYVVSAWLGEEVVLYRRGAL